MLVNTSVYIGMQDISAQTGIREKSSQEQAVTWIDEVGWPIANVPNAR
jgi:hypothetical protein